MAAWCPRGYRVPRNERHRLVRRRPAVVDVAAFCTNPCHENASPAPRWRVVKRMTHPTWACLSYHGIVSCSCFRRFNKTQQARARPRDFKQPLHPDAASQILLAGVGALVCLAEEEDVRKHEVDMDFPSFDRTFGVR